MGCIPTPSHQYRYTGVRGVACEVYDVLKSWYRIHLLQYT